MSPAVLGAGNDDLEPGRAYLKARAAGEALPDEVPDLYPYAVGLGLVAPTLEEFGTAEQQARWSPTIPTGEEIWCQLFSEPDAGSDLAGLRTSAERDGDVWRVTGSKVWASRAHYADWGLLLARTDWSVPKHAGITAFGLDMKAAGVEVRPLVQMNGDAHFNQVFLDGVEVPDSDRIGDVGQGWPIARSVLALERGGGGGLSGGSLGLGDPSGVLDLVRAQGRADDAVVRQRAAQVYVASEVARLAGRSAPGSKIRMAQILTSSSGLALDVLGPYGMLDDGAWATTFLTAPSLSIRGGTDEIQRSQVAERVLGLPREPSVDRDVPFQDLPK